jgi:hypothetical protein
MTDPKQIQNTVIPLWWPGDKNLRKNIYAILDPARDDGMLEKLFETDLEMCCLFPGTEGNDLRAVAPYLVALKETNPVTKWLLERGWGKSWGIFAESSENFIVMRRHFRKFFIVYDEQGQSLFFRYYDPRVLRVFFPTCDKMQLAAFFGPVVRYFVESEDGNALIQYSPAKGRLMEHTIDFAGVGAE